MTHTARLLFFLGLIAVFSITSGCAKKRTSRIGALEAQVNQITDELVRLDQSVQELRATQASQGPAETYATEAPTGGSSIYRTPSGFELPSRNIQAALKNAGYYQGSLDGKIGSGTKQAVKAFQRDNGLEADGVVGRQTWDKLKTYLGAGAQ